VLKKSIGLVSGLGLVQQQRLLFLAAEGWARLKIRGRCSKNIKQPNRVSISVSLGLGLMLVLGLGLVSGLVLGLVLGLMPSSDIVLKSTVLSSSFVPKAGNIDTDIRGVSTYVRNVLLS